MGGGAEPESHAWNEAEPKSGIVGCIVGQSSARPHKTPVPRGPNIHLCVPAAKKSQPRDSMVSSSTPKPWAPSTQKRARSAGAREALARATASAMALTGVFTPVDECTQVTATILVLGWMAR